MKIDLTKKYTTKNGSIASIKSLCIDSCNDVFFVVDITDPGTRAYSNQALRFDYKRKNLRHPKNSNFDISLEERKLIREDGTYVTKRGLRTKVLGHSLNADLMEVAVRYPNSRWEIYTYNKYGQYVPQNFGENYEGSELDLEIVYT